MDHLLSGVNFWETKKLRRSRIYSREEIDFVLVTFVRQIKKTGKKPVFLFCKILGYINVS